MTLEYKKPTVENIPDDELFFGHKACAGCGGSLAVRAALKVLGPHAVCALPAGCMSAVGFNFPQLSFANNAMITPFAATAAVAAGIEAGLRAQGKKPDDCTVVGIAGDGGTADIGIQALSGAIDRNDGILYICYDNEAYMNTGIQKSSLTPFGASTTTTPAGGNVGYLPDFMNKVARAASIKGTKYIHVIAPCPTGWGCAVDETVELAKEIVDCGLWYLAEYEGPSVANAATDKTAAGAGAVRSSSEGVAYPNGRFAINRDPREFASVEAYLRRQGRFRSLTDEEIAQVERQRDLKWRALRDVAGR